VAALPSSSVITLPWTLAAATPSGSVTVIAARLPLRSVRSLPATLAWTWRLRRALRDAPGLAGYAFAMPISGSPLWTVSAWTSRTELTAFQHNAAHQAAQTHLRARLQPATFAVWNCPAAQLPVPWPEVKRRIFAGARTQQSRRRDGTPGEATLTAATTTEETR
jgi:hypothetical protein